MGTQGETWEIVRHFTDIWEKMPLKKPFQV